MSARRLAISVAAGGGVVVSSAGSSAGAAPVTVATVAVSVDCAVDGSLVPNSLRTGGESRMASRARDNIEGDVDMRQCRTVELWLS
jgi:hypothetical protein